MEIYLPDLDNYTSEDYQVAESMLKALWHRFANNLGATSLPYYMDKFSDHNQANRMIRALAKEGIIETSIVHNFATIQLQKSYVLSQMTEDEMYNLMRETKLNHYKPVTKPIQSAITGSTNTKLASGIQKTGIVRMGFAKAGKHSFQYDTTMMKKYHSQLVEFSIKSMTKLEEELGYSLMSNEAIDYASIIEAVIDSIIDKNETYYLGKLTNDSRGRAIYEILTKVFNPIANKMARALVMAPPVTVDDESILDDTFLFIAELVSGFDGDVDHKLVMGKQYYQDKVYHKDATLDDLFENIWLERIYADLDTWYADNTHKFTTPIEEDFSASNMTISGLLLGHSDYIDHTRYMWEVEGLSKLHVKKAQTPYVFGSRAPITRLWKKAGLDWTSEQVRIMRFQQAHGKFAVANELKDILVGHCQPTAEMRVQIGDENFTIECNRFKHVGDTTKQYVAYDTTTSSFKVVSHTTTHKVPDLFGFKTYFATLLTHNVDSQLMNNIVKSLDWVIPIHDAGIVTVTEARKIKDLAVTEMLKLRRNGSKILFNYLKSINLDDEGWKKYAKLQQHVADLNKDKQINITPWLLK